MKKILVINVNWVGDAIFSTAVFKALKKTYPDATVTCLGVPRIREIIECSPYVDAFIEYDEKSRHWSPFAKLKLILEIRQKKFDVAFLLHRSLTRALLVFLAGIPERVGYDTKGRGIFLTHKVKVPSEDIHRMDRYLKVIESFGVDAHDRQYELFVTDETKRQVDQLLNEHNISDKDFFVVVNLGGNWNLKRWSKQNFALLIKHLINDFNVKVVIPGAEKDVTLANEIKALSTVDPVILTGKTNLKQLMALMKRANLVISADSGPMHVASSVGASIISLFGPTRAETTGTRGIRQSRVIQYELGCNERSCYYLECPDNICMKAITVEDVLQKFREIKNK